MVSFQRIAAVECGGTSFKLAICSVPSGIDSAAASSLHDDGVVIEVRDVVSTAAGPVETLNRVASFLQAHGPYAAVGIASFGPVSVNPNSVHYGRILDSSPKIEWRGVDILGAIQSAVGKDVPIRMDTDVNAPAAAEYQTLRSSEILQFSTITSCAYITIGTGVGVGLVVNGKTVHGRMHPEGGHVPVAPLAIEQAEANATSTFSGYSWGKRPGSKCPFAGEATVEGFASSVSLTERYYFIERLKQGLESTPAFVDMDRDVLQTVPDDHEIWEHAAHTIASLCTTLLLTLSMEHIVLGGGVMQRRCLLSKIRAYVGRQLNGYLDLGSGGDDAGVTSDLQRIITTSIHGDDAGLYGAIFLARQVSQERHTSTEMKQDAFRVGLWQGLLVGVLGTTLIFQYGWVRACTRKHR